MNIETQFEFCETPLGIYLINDQDLIGHYIKNNMYWEKHMWDFYSYIIQQNWTVIDAGANLGYHTIQFAKLANTVYSFEPQRFVFNQLCTNVLFNTLSDKVKAYCCGVGKEKEVKQFNKLELQDFGNGIINYGGRGFVHLLSDTVIESDFADIISIDSLNISKCELIKMDVQGYELLALQGASILIKNNYPIVLMENSQNDADKKSLEFLTDMGYECYRYILGNSEDCIILHPNSPHYTECLNHIEKMSKTYKIVKDI